MSQPGRDDTQRVGTLFNYWVLELTLAGKPLKAEKVLHRSIAIGQDNRGEETVSPMLLVPGNTNLGKDLGHFKLLVNLPQHSGRSGRAERSQPPPRA